MRFARFGTLLPYIFQCCLSLSQPTQVTGLALFRTFMIETIHGRGTAFSVDVDDREYWITAKHMFTGIKTGPSGTYTAKTVIANVLSNGGEGTAGQDQHWRTQNFSVLDPGKDIDILVLVPPQPLIVQGKSLRTDGMGVALGGDCEFLGFPYGGGWKGQFEDKQVWLPYIKHCTVSALLHENGLVIWVLDGINNEGFSGGPVVAGSLDNQQVFAVVSGFHQEPLEVVPAPPSDIRPTNGAPLSPPLRGTKSRAPEKQMVNANSGFIIAFDLQSAIDIIHKNPIGPIRPKQ